MASDDQKDSTAFKIFPRNLTARADYLVRGNPANSRPESGVDNCYPGLEFDQRNLEQVFFPGLRFEFQREDGAILSGMSLDESRQSWGLTSGDSPPGHPLYLWFLYGRNKVEDAEPTLFPFRSQTGIEVWRRINDLLPGRVAIIIGPAPGFGLSFNNFKALDLLKSAYAENNLAGGYYAEVVRSGQVPGGPIEYAVLAQDRARYLDEDGVIDVNAYAPGELTKSLCAPWMYDFRDCYCFYWAANKPDVVGSADGQHPYLNFIRRERSDPPPSDIANWRDREDNELTYRDMVEGWWHRLPIVLDDRESPFRVPSNPAKRAEYLTRRQVISELNYLATVEHALTVEYLYALYSLNAPREHPGPGASATQRQVWAAASQLFQIAVDEMRHFLWVNQVLELLGAPPATGRADFISEPPKPRSGRKVYRTVKKEYFSRPFELSPLVPDTLQWFIDVEAPSSAINQGLDGMYVEILRSVCEQPHIFPDKEHIVPLIKLIIDEGVGHFEHLNDIQQTLAVMAPEEYLRPLDGSPTAQQSSYLDLCDGYYHSILEAIVISFSLGGSVGSTLLRNAIRSMESLDDLARTLAEQGVGLRFELPQARRRRTLSHEEAMRVLASREARLQRKLGAITEKGDGPEVTQAEQHQRSVAQTFGRLREVVMQDMSGRAGDGPSGPPEQ